MFELNEVVKIKEFEHDCFNCEGKVNDFNGLQYHVINSNLSFYENISDWYFDYELDKKLKD